MTRAARHHQTPTATFRGPFMRWTLFGICTVLIFVSVSLIVFNVGPRTEGAAPPVQRGVASFFTALLVFFAVRIVRSGIFTYDDGVLFRNFIRTYWLPWPDVVRFESPARYGSLLHSGLKARLNGGQVVYSSLYAAGPLNRPTFADPVVARLNSLKGQIGHSYQTGPARAGRDP